MNFSDKIMRANDSIGVQQEVKGGWTRGSPLTSML
jgi:hypothetical protein